MNMKRIFCLLVCCFSLSCMDDEPPAKKKKIEIVQDLDHWSEFCSVCDSFRSLGDLIATNDINAMQALYEKGGLEYATLCTELANLCSTGFFCVEPIKWLLLHGADFSYFETKKHTMFCSMLQLRDIPGKFIVANPESSRAPFVWQECAQEVLVKWKKQKPTVLTMDKVIIVACLWSVVRLHEICECKGSDDKNFYSEDIVREYEGCYECVKKVGMLERFEHEISFNEGSRYYYHDLRELMNLVGRYKVRGELQNNKRLAPLCGIQFLFT